MHAAQREKTLKALNFSFGSDHPLYHAIPGLLSRKRDPYAFYMRVPDLPAFLRQITPALEQRLCQSPCSGHSGELKISFYRSGVRLVFEQGRLVNVEGWQPVIKEDEGGAAFPNLTFLQVLFGYRSLNEIRYAYPDCWASDTARPVLEAIFPKKASSVWSLS